MEGGGGGLGFVNQMAGDVLESLWQRLPNVLALFAAFMNAYMIYEILDFGVIFAPKILYHAHVSDVD